MIALAFGVVAVLHQIDTDPAAWAATEQGSIYASREQLQRFITNPDSVEKVRENVWVCGSVCVMQNRTLMSSGYIDYYFPLITFTCIGEGCHYVHLTRMSLKQQLYDAQNMR